MKQTMVLIMRKTISFIMVLILLLGVLTGCGDAQDKNKETTPSVNLCTGYNELDKGENGNNDDSMRVFTLDSLEPLSKEKQEEVESAWKEKYNGDRILQWCKTDSEMWIVWGEKYYGTLNGCIVIFSPGAMIGETTITVAGKEIMYESDFVVWVYSEGEFMNINTAYECALLSDADISNVVQYHEEFMQYKYTVLNGG